MIAAFGGLNRNSVSVGLVHNFAKLRLEVNLELAITEQQYKHPSN